MQITAYSHHLATTDLSHDDNFTRPYIWISITSDGSVVHPYRNDNYRGTLHLSKSGNLSTEKAERILRFVLAFRDLGIQVVAVHSDESSDVHLDIRDALQDILTNRVDESHSNPTYQTLVSTYKEIS